MELVPEVVPEGGGGEQTDCLVDKKVEPQNCTLAKTMGAVSCQRCDGVLSLFLRSGAQWGGVRMILPGLDWRLGPRGDVRVDCQVV